MRKEKFYIAAPFFNDQQKEIVEKIEKRLRGIGIEYFSPRHSIYSKEARQKGMTPQLARKIFELNVVELESCSTLIAVLEWALAPGGRVFVSEPAKTDQRIYIPDSGTVWELGNAHALEKPPYIVGIYGLTQSNRKINLMLQQACDLLLFGTSEVDVWFSFLENKRKGEQM